MIVSVQIVNGWWGRYIAKEAFCVVCGHKKPLWKICLCGYAKSPPLTIYDIDNQGINPLK